MGIPRERSNQFIYLALRGLDKTMTGSGDLIYQDAWNRDICGAEYSFDSNNPWWLHTDPVGKNLDIGAPLDLRSIRYEFPIVGMKMGTENIGIVRRYDGPVIANPGYTFGAPSVISDLYSVSSDSAGERISLGATAISRCKPASPQASFAVFLGEILRDGIPSLLMKFNMKTQMEYFKSIGGNYLNVEFGWKPFISDLRKTAVALDRQATILEDLRRNSGKAVRRQYEFPVEDVSTTVQGNDFPWPTPTPYHLIQDRSTLRTDIRKRTWFSGEFRYYYPPVTASVVQRVRGYSRTILGIDLTPETLWNLAPWTWLADWFANIGDIAANVSAISEDNLTMRYGYLMQEVVKEYTMTHHNVFTWYGKLPSTFSGRTIVSHKTRIGASPYGFGSVWADLTPRQVAILAAIGITQGGRAR